MEQESIIPCKEDFRIAIICALPVEANMVEAIFDIFWPDKLILETKDQGRYTLGMIANHNIVLAHMGTMGGLTAAIEARDLKSTFPGIEVAFVAGICGVVPVHPETKAEIVLGDCIISTAIIHYDNGRRYPNGHFEMRMDIQHSNIQTNLSVKSFVAKLSTDRSSADLTTRSQHWLARLQECKSNTSYPGIDCDRLFPTDYIHHHRPINTYCKDCNPKAEVCMKDCASIGCEFVRVLQRDRLRHVADAKLSTPSVLIHFGRVGSGETVMKSGQDRDSESKQHTLVAFEMEGHGVQVSFPTLIVKSACDYADSHKSKEWQRYAATTAAATLRSILEMYPPTSHIPCQQTLSTMSSPSRLSRAEHIIPFEDQNSLIESSFFGRKVELQSLCAILLPDPFFPQRKSLVLYGSPGLGKTHLAREFLRQHHASCSAVIWIDGSDRNSICQSLQGYRYKLPADLGLSKHARTAPMRAGLEPVVQEMLDWLELRENHQWLLVFDNVNRQFDSSDPSTYDLGQYLPVANHGSILILTRLNEMELVGPVQILGPVDKATAKAIFRTIYAIAPNEELAEHDLLVEYLGCIPSEIIKTAQFLQSVGLDISDFQTYYDSKRK